MVRSRTHAYVHIRTHLHEHVRGTEQEIAGACFDKRLIAFDLLRSKTIEQPVTAGAAQIVLAAAAIGTSRRMRRIPRM